MPDKKFLLPAILLFLFLSLRFIYYFSHQENLRPGENLSFTTAILSSVNRSGSFQTFTVETPGGTNVLIVADNKKDYSYGDSLKIVGTVNRKVLDNGKSIFVIFTPKIESNFRENNWFLAITLNIRQRFVDFFERILPQKEASLLLGIVFGIKENIPKDFNEILRNSGVLHVIAASGMNVTLVAGFISGLLGYFLNRRVALLISLLAIIFYASLAGFAPSIVRASVMGVVVFSAQIIGRQAFGLYSLFLAAGAMLFYDPGLISDIGFQLSFSATLGILFIKPIFDSKKVFKKIFFEDFATTVSAQIATIPIMFANFGTYSLVSVIANVLVLWTIPPLMVIGGIGGIIGILWGGFGSLFLYLCLPLLFFFEKVVSFWGSKGYLFSFEGLSWEFFLGYYLLIVSFIIFLRKNEA